MFAFITIDNYKICLTALTMPQWTCYILTEVIIWSTSIRTLNKLKANFAIVACLHLGVMKVLRAY